MALGSALKLGTQKTCTIAEEQEGRQNERLKFETILASWFLHVLAMLSVSVSAPAVPLDLQELAAPA